MKIAKLTQTRSLASFILLALLVTLAGCIPKRVVWSPDGKIAAVLGEQGLYLCDGDGTLSGVLVSNVQVVAWFTDSRRLAIAREESFDSWAKIQPYLDAETRGRILKSAPVAIEQFKAGRTKDEISATFTNLDDNEKIALGIYLKGLDATKSATGTNWPAIEALEMKIMLLQVGTVEGGKISLGPVLASDWDREMIVEIRVAPGQNALAYTTAINDNNENIKVVPVDGSGPAQLVATEAAWYPDWSADGRSLVYIQAIGAKGDNDLQLGTLQRQTVLNEAGKVQLPGKSEDLAGLMFYPLCKVRCLNDGRIIFSAMAVHLPATSADMPDRQQLFALDPDRQSTVTPLIPAGVEKDIPEDLSFFELSPDQKRISIAGKKSEVVIFTPAAGTVDQVQAATDEDLQSVPAWRSNGELTYIVIPTTNGVEQPAQIALWRRDSKPHVISGSWPAEVREKFLDK